MTSIADLDRELHERRQVEYGRLQHAALVKLFTAREGQPPADQAELVKRFPGQAVPTLDPSRYLSEAEARAVLSATTTG